MNLVIEDIFPFEPRDLARPQSEERSERENEVRINTLGQCCTNRKSLFQRVRNGRLWCPCLLHPDASPRIHIYQSEINGTSEDATGETANMCE
jgi:hypothetical protein